MSQRRIVRASELAEYGFCKRSWWFSNVRGERSQNIHQLKRGTHAHEQHAWQIVFGHWFGVLGYAVVILAFLWLVLRLVF